MSAAGFRSRYCPGEAGAVDFEVIIEHDLGIDIMPINGLMAITGKYGALSADGKCIYVDAAFQRERHREYVSLLLHEVGHLILHIGLVTGVDFSTKIGFVMFQDSISEVMGTQLEWEAKTWAMRVQMPLSELQGVFNAAVELAEDMFPRLNGAARLYVQRVVASYFQIGEMRAQLRIDEERLWHVVARSQKNRGLRGLSGQEGAEKRP